MYFVIGANDKDEHPKPCKQRYIGPLFSSLEIHNLNGKSEAISLNGD